MAVSASPVDWSWSLAVFRMKIDRKPFLHHEPDQRDVAVEGGPVGAGVAVLVPVLEDVVAVGVVQMFHLFQRSETKAF